MVKKKNKSLFSSLFKSKKTRCACGIEIIEDTTDKNSKDERKDRKSNS